MIKKISAVVLALVLCLSVIVVPASAAKVELGSAQMAFTLEWDKTSYNAGDTAYLSVYMDAADDLSLYTGSFIIGLNSSVFKQADNAIADVKENSVTSELFNSYWKAGTTNLSWLPTTVVTKVVAANTAEENAKYDQYLKFTAARNSAGSHENVANTKDGFHGNEFNPDEAIMVLALKVASDVADGTAVEAAITSGSLTVSPVQTSWKYYTNAGNATTTANIAATNIDVSKTIVTATVGAAASIVKDGGAQIRFRGIGATGTAADYKGTFDVRTIATISQADFAAKIGTDAEALTKITDIGFVYATATNVPTFDADKAKGVAEGTPAEGYVKKAVNYIQHEADGADYKFTCLIRNIADADKNETVNALAYVCCDGTYYYFDAPVAVSYAALYERMPK